MNILESEEIINYFNAREYDCIRPHGIENNSDTVFVSAGIQPIVQSYREDKIEDNKKLFIPQPVIRTQFANSVSEGSSIAFVNITSSCFNHSEEEHMKMIKEWYELFYILGMKKSAFTTTSDTYEATWGDLELLGNRIFHYYNGLEIGDTTFFTKVKSQNEDLKIETMSDLGFGLERLRWKINDNHSYYDLYSLSNNIDKEVKAYLSVLALLAVNDIKPSNKNSGYRARLFSKKLVNILQGRDLNELEMNYLNECLKYWSNWQQINGFTNIDLILNEFIRNGNRFIIDALTKEGYNKLGNININISREELYSRLTNSGVEKERVRKLKR